jgi:hypothetical protein
MFQPQLKKSESLIGALIAGLAWLDSAQNIHISCYVIW